MYAKLNKRPWPGPGKVPETRSRVGLTVIVFATLKTISAS
jgi:hypothetical protein